MCALRSVFVIIILCACPGDVFSRTTSRTACETVKPFFDGKNISIEYMEDEPSKTTCGGSCCSSDMEHRIRNQAKSDFQNLMHHHSRTLQGLLASTADAIRDTVTVLVRHSENRTLTLFNQVYRTMAVETYPSVKSLYRDIVNYVAPENTPDSLQQPRTRDMLYLSFLNFFDELFPTAFHRAVDPLKQDFSKDFKSCLREAVDSIKPFGDIPKQISQSVVKSLEATRVLIQALTLGKNVLDKTDGALFSSQTAQQTACFEALQRMTYCSKCHGIASDIRPCSALCINVIRGCLIEPASQFDMAWSGYVESVERLVIAIDGRNNPLGLNVESAIRQLDTRISDAIMHAMENGPELKEKVRAACDRTKLVDFVPSNTTTMDPVASYKVPAGLRLGNFLASVGRSRSFYGTLADTICEDYPDKHCWNGDRVGDYMKTIVDSSLTAQKYNPELPLLAGSSPQSLYDNANTSELIDQLRHVNQIVQSQLASTPDTGALLSDGTFDGSGSGAGPDSDAESDGYEASGSGEGSNTNYSSSDNGDVRTAMDDGLDRAAAVAHNMSPAFLLCSVILVMRFSIFA
ncbi:division abnormally delayed protein [Neodiprion pinetum]|uniref:Division abnormally delayed protein n=1 Tax=Neodiprion lecontei TaxID=441921 RepID=A0A6J0BZT5_NEOLC|nr:division abnormally delayed protein [Neodiprion lecontei]XP_046468463.1 division abnormally delayed protein [Neodiprion pinetum]